MERYLLKPPALLLHGLNLMRAVFPFKIAYFFIQEHLWYCAAREALHNSVWFLQTGAAAWFPIKDGLKVCQLLCSCKQMPLTQQSHPESVWEAVSL